MISFIIPTLWKSGRIFKTIEAVKTSRYGIELIIIDNANSDFESDHSQIKVLKPGSNIFVNPAWNLGVEHANHEYVCLLNDDIELNIHLFVESFHRQIINSSLKDNLGILAYESGKRFDNEINSDDDILEPILSDKIGTGFGQLMLFEKRLYYPIPDPLKIYFGDNLLHVLFAQILNRDIMYFKGLKVVGELSLTSKDFEEELQKEFKFWKQSVSDLYNKYNFK